jgi:glucosamine-6-phosphate deaminase
MEVIIQPNPEAATHVAARILANKIQKNPSAILGLATGSTPVQLYQELIKMKLDWSSITSFNLDEYIGLGPEHPASYNHFMREHLFNHINIPKNRTHVPDGLAKDIPASCRQYEKQIQAAGGIDLQLLGIGVDGHIGFNEPTSSLTSRTRIKTLTESTCHANARFFNRKEDVPKHVITMGIGTILDSHHCLLLAFGKNKAHAIAEAVEGSITAMNPASALQLHRKTTICLDQAAASKLKLKDYYQWVFENKPDWQKV